MNSKLLLEQLKMITVWLPVKNYDNYEVSICGMVRNVKTKLILKPWICNKGYYAVGLCKNGKVKKYNVHRLVAKHFIPNLSKCKCVDHINCNTLDNTVSNLRWCTQQQNCFNSSLSSINTSGIKGVWFDKARQKWAAEIKFNNKKIFIGRYEKIEDAKQARQSKAKELFGEFINDCEL